MTLEALVQPLLQQARAAVPEECDTHALVTHNWSHLHYGRHTRKTGRSAEANRARPNPAPPFPGAWS